MHGIRFGLPKGTAVAAATKYAALLYANVGLEKYESAKENLRLVSEAIEALGTTAYKAARENGTSEVGFVDFENGILLSVRILPFMRQIRILSLFHTIVWGGRLLIR